MGELVIEATPLSSPPAQHLVAAAMAELVQRYGSGDGSPLRTSEFEPPCGCFLVAWRASEPVACVGWRTVDLDRSADAVRGTAQAGVAREGSVAEIKRMYVVPDARGTGVAAAILAAAEQSAREHGRRRMILETGLKQPEAIRFYAKSGYERIENYGYYRDYPDCVSFARAL